MVRNYKLTRASDEPRLSTWRQWRCHTGIQSEPVARFSGTAKEMEGKCTEPHSRDAARGNEYDRTGDRRRVQREVWDVRIAAHYVNRDGGAGRRPGWESGYWRLAARQGRERSGRTNFVVERSWLQNT